MPSPVRDLRPPRWAMRYVNPVIRLELRSPLARLLPWALLRFDGRRTGRPIEIVVRVYRVDGGLVTFTPNPWRANFDEPRRVTLRYKRTVRELTAELVRDATEVAAALNALLDEGLWVPGGLRVPRGARFDAAAVAATDTALLRFS